MASPALDNINAGGAAATNTITVSTTTSHANGVIIVWAGSAAASSPPAVSTVAATGLVFTKYTAKSAIGVTGQFTNEDIEFEIWTAPVATAGSYSITVTWAANFDVARMVAAGVSGAYDTTSWQDGDTGMPYSAVSASGAPSVTYNTQQADDLLLYSVLNDMVTGQTTPTGWTDSQGPTGTLGTSNRALMSATYSKSVSSAQTSQSVSAPASFGGIGILIAVTADAKGGAFQTFVTIICS